MAVRQGYRFWGELEGDDITKLPEDIEAKVTDDNKVYFVKYGTNDSQLAKPHCIPDFIVCLSLCSLQP